MGRTRAQRRNLLIAALVTAFVPLFALPMGYVTAQTVSPNTLTFSIPVGNSSSQSFNLTNNLGSTQTFDFSSAPPTGVTVTFAPDPVTLNNNQAQSISVAVSIAQGTATGSYSFPILANGSALVNVNLTVTSPAAATSVPAPTDTFTLSQTGGIPSGRAGDIIIVNMQISASSSVDTPFTFTIPTPTGLPSGVTVIQPSSVTVAPNSTQTFQLQLSTPSNLAAGTYTFQVSADGTEVGNSTLPSPLRVSSFARFAVVSAGTPTAGPVGGAICPETTNVPGGDLGGAKLILVDVEEAHGICQRGEEDWFKFGAVGGKVYTIDVSAMDAGLDLSIELYDSEGRLLTTNDDFFARGSTPTPADIKPRIQSWRAPYDGLFYFRIRDTLNIGGNNLTYKIIVRSESYGPTPVTVPEVCRDLFEEDGLPEEAKLITSNEIQPNRRLCPTGDADWVKFFGKAGKIYYIYTDTRPYKNNPAANPTNPDTQAGADTIIFLADRDGISIIDFNDDIDSPETPLEERSLDSQIRFVPSVDGFYFIQVKNTGDIGNQFIRYDLVLTQCFPGRECGRATSPAALPSGGGGGSGGTGGGGGSGGNGGTGGTTPTPASPTETPVTFPDATATQPPSFLEQNQPSGIEMINGPLVGFADAAFERVWQRSDWPVARGQVNRSWLWGPRGLMARTEGYIQAEGGLRQVQYFDKGRMEVSNKSGDRSSPWFVTTGLLSLELVTGRMQIGDNDFVQRPPADIPIAGDQDDPSAPTYASFSGVVAQSAEDRTGKLPAEMLNRAGQTSPYDGPQRAETRLVRYIPETGHNIAGVFWDYMNASGSIYVDGQTRSDKLMDWVFTMGYPVSEPFWTRVRVGGVERDVLVQIFQRRVLTYSPDNPRAWQVEMGNVGRHYYRWRYGEDLPPS